MSRPLLAVGPGKEVSAGLFSARDPESGPFWFDGENVVFRNLGVEKLPGWSELGVALSPVRSIAQAYVSGDKRAYFVSEEGRVRYYSSALGIVKTIGTLADGLEVDLEIWGSWLVLARPNTALKVWKNTGGLVNVANQPFTWAKILKRKNEHLLAFNTSNGDNWAEWSSASAMEVWTPSSSNTAGNLPFRDLDSDIVCVKELGDMLAVYSRESMALMNWIGRPNVFGKRKALNGAGAVSRNSVISYSSLNYGLNRRGIFETDGVGLRYVDEPALSGWLAETVDWSRQAEIHGHNNELIGQMVWFFPDLDGVWRGVGYNPANPGFTKFLAEVYASSEKSVFDYPLLGLADSMSLHDGSLNAGGDTLPFRVRTKPLDGGSALNYKLWDLIKTVGDWENTKVRIGEQEDINSEPSWFYDGDLTTNLHPDRETPFLTLEFYSTLRDSEFHLTQIVATGEPTGSTV